MDLSITDPSPLPPPPAAFNLAAHVLGRGSQTPDKSALQILRLSGAERWSYGRLEAAVRGVASGLISQGLQPGDRVLMRLGNTVEFPLAFLGAIAAGIVPVPTSALLTVPEVTKLARMIAPKAVIAAKGVALPEGDLPVIDAGRFRAWEDLPPAPFQMGPADRLAYVVTTSGTSGLPRAVGHAHRAILGRALMHEGWYGITAEDRLLHAGAFNWTYTLGTGLMDPWTVGATALIPAPGIPPAQLPLLLKRFDATIFAAAPGVYRQMLRDGKPLALPRLRHGLSAGERLMPSVCDAWGAATGTAIYEALGMSECSTFISGSPARPAPEGTTGYPQPGRRIAVLEDGQPVPRGQMGELAIHRSDPGLMLGYLGADGRSELPLTGDWFLTGDTVEMQADGAIRYLGRRDDMLNAGGFRVAPAEIEAALATCPGAGEVAAVELRIREDATIIAVFHTGPTTEAALAAHAETCLARYKQPRLYRHVAALPHTANGKLNRRALRAEWEEKL